MKNSNPHPISWQNSAVTSVLLTLILLFSTGLSAQIWAPEGLNMPGAWNEWANPPANNLALASSTQVAGGRVTRILKATPSGIDRYQTIFSASASGGDVTGGTHEWLFTSGSTSNPWGNKWGGVTVTMNTLQNYTFSGGAPNNSITLTNDKWYTMNWKDSGYSGTQAIYMETSSQPIDLTSVSVPGSVPANQPETITLTTASTPAGEELFYLLYTTNNWATSSAVSFSMTGSSGTATIPGQGAGAVVKYYAFSSTIGSITDNYDLYTIKINNNGGNFYSYTVSGLSTQAEILNFSMAEQVAPALINPVAATVTLELTPNTPLTALSPAITVSDGASINPASGVIRDFTNPVTYNVTAEDGTTIKVWTVTVTNAVPNYGIRDDDGVNLPTLTYWYTGQGSDITQKGTEFNNNDLGPLSSLFIRGSAIQTYKTGAGDVTGAQFNYKVWNSSDAEPAEYIFRNVNWSSNDGDGNQTWAGFGTQIAVADGLPAGNYNLKVFFTISGTGIAGVTEDGPFSSTFQVQEFSTEAEILDFTLAEQTGSAIINTIGATVTIEVANGTLVTSLTPTISISAGATIDPLSGVEQDFTTPVIYTVTSESGSTKAWTVTVNEAAPPSITWANLQWPADGNITPNQSFNVYAQVYAEGVTNGTGQGAGIQAWIGYGTGDPDPQTWTNWIPATFQGDNGNNDEYLADLGAAIGTAGVYYYASRFQLDDQTYVYGGFQGGIWDGTNNISGTLTVNPPTSKTLTFTVLLEGLYSSNGQMNQASGDSGPQFGPGIADLITVELHNETDYSITEHTFTGVELGTDGSVTVEVPANISGNYFLTVRHRNSIAITSTSAISFTNESILHDFTQPANVYGSNLLQMTDGWYAVYGGDVNQDGVVDTGDVTPLDNDQFNYLTGYVATDANGDGSVDTGDITIVDNNQFNYIASLNP